jgi:hypothetical protein
VLVLLTALFLFGARLSLDELHNNAFAFGGVDGAWTHVPKVRGLMVEGNTAFWVEFFKY